jgi:hypothetical protein
MISIGRGYLFFKSEVQTECGKEPICFNPTKPKEELWPP